MGVKREDVKREREARGYSWCSSDSIRRLVLRSRDTILNVSRVILVVWSILWFVTCSPSTKRAL